MGRAWAARIPSVQQGAAGSQESSSICGGGFHIGPAIDTLLIATVNEHSAVVLPSRPRCRLLSSDYMQVGAEVVRGRQSPP